MVPFDEQEVGMTHQSILTDDLVLGILGIAPP